MAVSRSDGKLAALREANPGVRVKAIDLTKEPVPLREVGDSHRTFIVCAGVDPANLSLQTEIIKNVIAAKPKRLIYISSCWSYTPLVSEVIDENHPRAATGAIKHRAAAEDAVVGAGGTVLHVPDFYGPRVHTSPLQHVISNALNKERVTWPANRDVVREHVFIGDLGEIVTRSIEAAPQGRFIVPGSGPISFGEMIGQLEAVLDRPIRSLSLGRIPTPILRLIDPWSRHLGEALDEYRKPVRYNGSLLRSHIGNPPTTRYEDGISSTIEWMRATKASA
jgi:nucleoside-diphosphate-sugar epimerase